MNDMPILWATGLKDAYPERSGPCGWGSMKLMLALRRALMESTWKEITDGCERYKVYCQVSGRAGTEFVLKPQKFIEEGCYLETFEYRAPEDPKVTAHKAQEAERWERANEMANALQDPIRAYQHESVGAFETRIRFAQNAGIRVRPATVSGFVERDARDSSDLSTRITDLTTRMKMIAK